MMWPPRRNASSVASSCAHFCCRPVAKHPSPGKRSRDMHRSFWPSSDAVVTSTTYQLATVVIVTVVVMFLVTWRRW